jgi:hypothetical protein
MGIARLTGDERYSDKRLAEPARYERDTIRDIGKSVARF